MDRTTVLALSFEPSNELLLSFKDILQGDRSFNFQVCEAVVTELSCARISALLDRSLSRLVVICASASTWAKAKVALELTLQTRRATTIVVLGSVREPEAVCEFLKLGAADVIVPPLRPVDLLPRLWQLCQHDPPSDPVVQRLKEELGLRSFVGESRALMEVIQRIPAAARSDASVLITGETGTGKEICARAIHYLSPRSRKPFAAVNCGAIPVDLMENELFGHHPGAFTGANGPAVGLLQASDGGSLFLDEVDCLPLAAQVKLLRFLQEKDFRPLGGHKSCQSNVRMIAASNVDLDDAVRTGRFRRDLLYRLNVIVFAMPALRERKEDIPALARHLMAKSAAANGAPARELTAAAMHKLMLYDWPGNVRELENVIERSLVLSQQAILRAQDIQLPVRSAVAEGDSFQTLKARMVADFERSYIQDLLRTHNGNITLAAHAAKKNRRAFWELMRKHGIVIPTHP